MADDNALSALVVEMRLNMAQFEEGLDKVNKLTQRTADDVDKSFSSITEGRGGLALASEAIGIHLPRHLQTLLAKIPAVGAAFSALLPIAGVVVAIEIIGKLIAAHDAAIAKAKEQKEAWENLTDKIREQSDALEVSNDRLRDTIAVFNGKAPNLVKLALDEAVVSADKLYNALKKDVDELEKLTEKQHVGILDQLLGNAGSAEKELQPYFDALKKADEEGKKAIALARETGDSVEVEVAQTSAKTAVTVAYNKALAAANDLLAKSNELQERRKSSTGIDLGSAASGGASAVIKDQTERMNGLSVVVGGLTDDYHRFALGAEQDSLSFAVALENPALSAKKLEEAQKALAKATKELSDAREKLKNTEAKELFASEKEVAKEFADDTKVLTARTLEYVKSLHDLGEARHALEQAGLVLGFKKEAEEIKAARVAGTTSEKQYLTDMQDLYSREEAALAKDIQDKINLHRAEAAAATARGDKSTQNAAMAEVVKEQGQLNALTAKYAQLQSGLSADLVKNQHAWQTYFATMKSNLGQIGASIRENLQASIDKATSAVSSSFAKMVVEGKSMGAAMKALAQEIAESFIAMLVEIGIRWVLSKLLETAASKVAGLADITTQAAVAGAGGVASMAAAPFPFDMDAPAFGAAMFADAMSYTAALPTADQGALINAPRGTGVPIMAHGQELILPSHLSRGLQSMISRGNRGGGTNVSMNIHAKDAGSFKQSQHQIQADMHRSINVAGRRDN